MTDVHDDEALKKRLAKEVGKARYGMLGLVGTDQHQHFQPMTPHFEEDEGLMWFFTRDDTDLARAVAARGGQAMYTVTAKDQDFQACIGGRLSLSQDRARIEKYWNPVIAAWYPDGKDDPHLTMIRFDIEDAALWLNEAGPVRFAIEIAKANITGREPDLGDRTSLNFN